jgi:molybdate transport repressor ModE-like protein
MVVSGANPDPRGSIFDSGLDLRQLAVLRAVAASGSLAGAARDLGVSQPTIAHHLGALEQTLTTAVVTRGPRGARLTEMGRLFAEQADIILDRLASAVEEVRALCVAGVETLRVGTFSSAGGVLLPAAVGEVQQQLGVRVELREAETFELLQDLETGALHVALVYNDGDEPLPIPEGWHGEILTWDPYLLAVPEGHSQAQQTVGGVNHERVRLGNFASEGWILSRLADPSADRSLLVAAAQEGFTPRPVLRTDDFHVALGFVATGLGVTVVPYLAAEPRSGVEYLRLADASLGRTIAVVIPDNPPPAVDVLVARLRKDAAAMGQGGGGEER